MSILVIIPAAGSGSRFGGSIPKQFQPLAGKPIVQFVVERFLLSGIAGRIVVPVAEALLQEMDIDAYFMEYDDDRSGDFRPLRYLPKGKMVVLGLVTTKFGELEHKDTLKRRIAEAAQYAPLEQLALSPQCGFSSTVHGNNIAVEAQRSKLRLVIETAQEVWGQS